MLASSTSTELFSSICDEGSLKRVFRRVEAEPNNSVLINLFKNTVVDLVANQLYLLDTLISELCRLARVFVHDIATRLWCWKTAARTFAQHYEVLQSNTVSNVLIALGCSIYRAFTRGKGSQTRGSLDQSPLSIVKNNC